MRPVSETFRAAVRRKHDRAARVSILDALLNPVTGGILTGGDGLAISGSVTMNRLRDVRRTLHLELANPAGELTPSVGGLFYWDRLIRAERGIVLDSGQPEFATLGTFIIDAPGSDVGPGRSVVSVAGADQMDRLLRSRFTAPVTYAAATALRDVASDIIIDAGGNANHLQLDDGGKTLAVDRTFEIGDERITALTDIVRAYALEVFADSSGIIVMHPIPDPTTLPTAWTFTAGDDAVMLGLSKRWSKERLYNHILVTGERAAEDPVYAEAFDNNAASPTYINGPLGDRLYRYTSAMITTEAQAQEVADALLYEHALIEEEITLPHAPNPALEVGDAIEVIEPISDTADRYIIDELTIPLGDGDARLVVRKLRSLL